MLGRLAVSGHGRESRPGRPVVRQQRARVFSLGLVMLCLLFASVPALAGDMSCTGRSESSGDDGIYNNDFDYGDGIQNDVGVIDGNDPATVALIQTVSTLVMDGDCIIKNFTQANPFPVGNINFWTPNQGTKPAYLIVFDNVYYEGNMACANIPHKLWLTNGSVFNITNSCQDYFIPVEKIDKLAPGATAAIGVPFTYTLRIPVMYDPVSGSVFNAAGSPNDLGNIHVTDDLTALGTGAEMTLVGPITYYRSTDPATVFTAANAGDSKHLDFVLPDVPASTQIIVSIPVVLDAANTPGTVFTNTAKWSFSRFIVMDVNGDGVVAPGEGRFFDPLPGEWGVSPPMTITGPNLIVNKTTTATAVNASNTIPYTIDAQNTGGWDAWNVTLRDLLPSNTSPASAPAKGMCETNPVTFGPGLAARIVQANGTTLVRNLTAGTDYTAAWGGTAGPDACTLSVTLTDAGGAIAPNQRLVVTYSTRLDTDFSLGGSGTLTNVAGATQWYNGASTVGGRVGFARTLSNGTPATVDHEDNATVTVAVSGYYFEKTVANLATGENPASTAAPGDRLRYRLHLFNVNQNISGISMSDPLGSGDFVLPPSIVACGVVGAGVVANPLTETKTPACSFGGGVLQVVSGEPGKSLVLPQGDDLVVEFELNLQGSLASGTVVSNQASMLATGITTQAGPYLSDDPADGVADPTVAGDESPTRVTIVSPGPLQKTNPASTSVVVGQQFSYQISVPATPVLMPLYDVQVLDTLPANLRLVSATAQVGATTVTLLDTDNGANNSLVLTEPATGLDIPAGQSAVVTLTVAVVNEALNQGGAGETPSSFSNSASYTYARSNGSSTRVAGAGNTTAAMTVREPTLTIAKTASNISAPGNPAVGGDVLEYRITLSNTGTASAFDTNVVDTLPPELALDAGFTPTATLNGVPVAGFNPVPAVVVGGTLAWGNDNADETLDIPVGGTLLLTYRASVVNVTGNNLVNTAYADWTSLDGVVTGERSGAGCPAFTAPDDYCSGPATVSLATLDTTTFSKAQTTDSWSTAPSTGSDGLLRVGDTATYTLTLGLREGETRGVVVTDALPAGMALESVSITPASGAANFSYALTAQPVAGATGTLTWNFGTLSNTPDSNAGNDQLVIQYVARVVANAAGTIAQVATSTLTNNAQLTYTDAAAALTGTDSILVRQPVMTDLAKTGSGSNLSGGDGSVASPWLVNLASSVMQFRLQSCNAAAPAAPAYGVVITDTLATQFDEASLSAPVVTVNGVVQSAGAGYVYMPPASRGGSLSVVLSTPVDPGQCAIIDYSVGFHDDVSTTTAWSNDAGLTDYWSLPANAGQHYTDTARDQLWMRNAANPLPPVKALSPALTEAGIGQTVTYTVTLPADNVIRNNVVVTDTLPLELAYDSATASIGGGAPVALTNTGTGQSVSLALGTLPAGQAAVVTLNTHVANSAAANAGDTFTNTASYTYTSGLVLTSAATPAVTVVEPQLAVTKNVAPTTPPVAGDILHYTVDLAASSGASFSTAFDVSLIDTLSMGLAYVPGSARLNGGVLADPALNGDGVATPQTLTWTEAALATDIAEGASVQVEYDVRVLNGVTPAQVLANTATARWTSLNGASANERTGSGSPAENDYVASDSTSLGAPDNTTFAKTRLTDTFNAGDASLRIGDFVDYELRIGLQEGTHNNVVVTDTLPAGLAFVGTVSINGDSSAPFSAAAPFSHADVTPAVAGNSITWTLGTVTNSADGNAGNDVVVIVYRARVQNNDTLAPLPSTQTLNNNAALNYTVGGTPVLPRTALQAVSVLQPVLSVSKSVTSSIGNDTSVVAGETLTWTVDITNSGTAPAYDTVLTDTLPSGLRQGGVTTTAIRLVNAGTVLPVLAPAWNAATGVASWNFDNGSANTYTIPAGETLRVAYTVLADANVGASLTLANSAVASLYYSLDDEDLPAGGIAGQREIYGPSNTATASVTTPAPGALEKTATQPTASIGDRFTYRITVPAVPVPTALNDVRITDDLVASAADLRFVSVAKVAGSLAWTPVNTGSVTNLVIEDITTGIDIPAGEQVTVDVTVELLNTASNVSGLVFSNTANYTYNQVANTPATRTAGLPGTSADMTITGADSLTLVKTGPATMRYGQPGEFILDVQNTGTATAWDIVLTDLLPNPAQGGMCDTAPTVTSVVVTDAGGTPLAAALTAGSDYTTAFVTGAANCTLTLTGVSAAAALAPTQRLRVTYQALLDPNNPPQTPLTNIAAATQWFSQNTAGGETRSYTGALTDGTVGTLDNQDARTVTTEWPTLLIQKSVLNVTTAQNPGSAARPGDRLRYTVRVSNQSPVPLPSFQLRDDLGALNAAAVFVPGSLALVTVPPGADTTATTATGGTSSAGLVDVRNLTLGVQGSGNDTVVIAFEATLAGVIDNGTVVLNQGQLSSFGTSLGNTDDPNVNGIDDPAVAGDEDATRTVISAAPLWQVQKVSQDLTGDPAVLQPGDTLRYTLTVKNVGNENALGVLLRDAVPSFTTYVPNTTTLNGVAVADAAAGVSALQAGLTLRAPGSATAGAMAADAGSSTANVATIAFSVTVNSAVVGGTIIANQGFVNGSGAGGSAFPEVPSDDPATSVVNDPTRDIVGLLPLLDAQKTVAIVVDNGTPGVADAGDTLRYTLTLANSTVVAATGVLLTDAVPANTTYVAASTRLNGAAVADVGGDSALVAGLAVNSAGAASGTIAGNASAVVVFDVQIAAAVPADTVISNQGFVASNEQALEPTDQDGIDTNGDQPTTLIVGATQQLGIVKSVTVVGGGAAMAGGFLDYSVQVTNTGTVPATQVLLRDDLAALGGNASYVAGSALLDGSSAGVSVSGNVISADYGSVRGTLVTGASTVLRFRVQIAAGVAAGTVLTNTGEVSWSTPAQSASSAASIAIGAMPGTATLSGQAWHDANFDRIADSGETNLVDWTVQLYRAGTLLGSTRTDTGGRYGFAGLAPVTVVADGYEVRFLAPGAGAATASLGLADSVFTNGQQRISGITGGDGSSVPGLNLPITPNGVVYDAVLRTPVAGATLTLVAAGSGVPVAASCFADPAQQDQVTLAAAYYKFELNFSDASCASGGNYLLQVVAPAGYVAGPSQLLPATTSAATAAFDVPSCPGGIDDAVPATAQACEAQTGAQAPAAGIASGAGTRHYLHLAFSAAAVPGSSQVFNNHLPLDPRLDNTLAISKTSALVNVSRGQIVPYVIRVRNPLPVPLTDMRVADRFPAGFKYVAGSARLDGVALEPVSNGRELAWDGVTLAASQEHVLKLLMVVGAGVGEGDYVNRAQVFSTITGGAASGEAQATVRVVPDPTFDCTDVIGKVYDDANLNGVQDKGEAGLPGVRLATARGLLITTDAHGRFHLTCAVVPDENRGSNFIVKLDDRSLPSGYRVTTANPEVLRVTRGKMIKFNFGAALHKVVRLDLANGVFEPGATTLRPQWATRLPLLLETLTRAPAVLRLAYLAEAEDEALVQRRLKAVRQLLVAEWARAGNPYELAIETEVFWRTGAPVARRIAK